MRPDFVGKAFDKQSDHKSRIDKGTKEREFVTKTSSSSKLPRKAKMA